MFKRLFCSHDYQIIEKIYYKSNFELVKESGYVPNTLNSTKSKTVLVLKCAKCKKMEFETIYS